MKYVQWFESNGLLFLIPYIIVIHDNHICTFKSFNQNPFMFSSLFVSVNLMNNNRYHSERLMELTWTPSTWMKKTICFVCLVFFVLVEILERAIRVRKRWEVYVFFPYYMIYHSNILHNAPPLVHIKYLFESRWHEQNKWRTPTKTVTTTTIVNRSPN